MRGWCWGLLVVVGCSASAATKDTVQASNPFDASVDGSSTTGDAALRYDAGSDDATGTEAPSSVADRCKTSSNRFITQVIAFDPGTCAGYGANEMPGVVCGPPEGGGADQGSTDVVSLGGGGSIVVGFGANGIVDGPGDDFIVFENPFDIGGNPHNVYSEPGEVSVSEDGVTWTVYPCTDTTEGGGDAGQCAGIHPVYSNPNSPNLISPFDVGAAGGDAYDLHTIGVTRARYVRIRDIAVEACPDAGPRLNTNGFDLDAISIVNALVPDGGQ
jgi:hypothetical protein